MWLCAACARRTCVRIYWALAVRFCNQSPETFMIAHGTCGKIASWPWLLCAKIDKRYKPYTSRWRWRICVICGCTPQVAESRNENDKLVMANHLTHHARPAVRRMDFAHFLLSLFRRMSNACALVLRADCRLLGQPHKIHSQPQRNWYPRLEFCDKMLAIPAVRADAIAVLLASFSSAALAAYSNLTIRGAYSLA